MLLHSAQLYLCICCCHLLAKSNGYKFTIDPMPADELQLVEQLSETLNLIFERMCASQNMSVFISTNHSQLTALQLAMQRRVLSKSVRRLEELVPLVLDKNLQSSLSNRIQLQLLFVQNAEQVIESSSSALKTKFLIVLFEDQSNQVEQQRVMSKIFDYFLIQRFTIDVLVLLMDMVRLSLKTYTFYPYTAGECESKVPVSLPTRALHWGQPFPFKLNNLHGCPLTVVVWHIPPFVDLDWNASRSTAKINGLDADILKVMSLKLNFSIALVPNEPPELIGGASYSNGSMTGAYHMLHKRRANMTLGCAACTTARSHFLTPTMPYIQMQYIIVLPSHNQYSTYEIMLLPFDIYTWLLFVGLAALRLLVQRWLRFSLPPMLCKQLHCIWLIMAFVLRSSYESSIFEFVHNAPTKPLPQTLQELVNKGYRVITDHATFRMTETIPRLHQLTDIVPGQPMDVFDALLSFPAETGAFSSKAFLAYHLTKKRQQRSKFLIMQEKIVDSMICIYFPKDSYMASAFNMQLLNMRSFGIFIQFSKRFDYANLPPTTASTRRRKTRADGSTGLHESTSFIMAALSCLLCAEAIAMGIFCLECLAQRCRRLDWLLRHL